MRMKSSVGKIRARCVRFGIASAATALFALALPTMALAAVTWIDGPGGSVALRVDLPVTDKAAKFHTGGDLVDSTKYVYDGKKKTPKVAVTLGEKKLSKSSYTVKYAKGRKAIGKYKVTVTLKKGKYKGAVGKEYFYITPKNTTITDLSASEGALTVKWKKRTKDVTGYQVWYSHDPYELDEESDIVDSYNDTFVLVKGAKKTSKKITKLESGYTYYVSVRTYKTVKGKKVYSKWAKEKEIVVK